jgi:exocyst complex component 2
MQQCLGQFVSPTAGRTLADVYNIISRSYVRRPGDEALTSLLDSVKKTLSDTRKGTRYEFLCFRPTAKDKPKEKSGGMSGTTTPTGRQGSSLGPSIPPVPSLSLASSAGRDSDSVSGSMSGSRMGERPPRRRPAAAAGARTNESPARSSDNRL